MKCTNLYMKDAACRHVIHILQYQTSRPTTKSTSNTIVSTQKHDLLPLAEGKYGILTKQSTRWLYQGNIHKSGFMPYVVWELRALCSVGCNKKLLVEQREQTQCLSNQEKRNGLRIMWKERQLWQESELKSQSQGLCKSRKSKDILKRWDRQPETQTNHLRRCLVLATGPNSRVGSISGSTWNWTTAVGLTTWISWTVEMGQFDNYKPDISWSQFRLQLCVWVLIVSWHEQYVYCAVWATLSLAAARMAIGRTLFGSILKLRKIHNNYGVISQRFNEYWSDCKSESGKWKSG